MLFLYCIICLTAGSAALFRAAGHWMVFPVCLRVPEEETTIHGRLPEENDPVIQKIFRPTARNGILCCPRT
jgi:hypothetical protein